MLQTAQRNGQDDLDATYGPTLARQIRHWEAKKISLEFKAGTTNRQRSRQRMTPTYRIAPTSFGAIARTLEDTFLLGGKHV